MGASGVKISEEAKPIQPAITNGLRRPKRVQMRSLFQATSGATKKLNAMLTLPRKVISAGSLMYFFIVKVSALPLHDSTYEFVIQGRHIKNTHHQGIRFRWVTIMPIGPVSEPRSPQVRS
ncbi:MAG: hypothetical protein BWZ10_01938 [candidate division BRC1 bacterium ADurb.BinA364]|nr:MAG: hypothetical protein BWZ10_01938 [candidate division BRC1 bacterium ADurb.BinA364]